MPTWLADALRDPDPDLREFAIKTALDFVGRTRASQKAPAWLLAALADEHPEVRSAARWACSTQTLLRGGSWVSISRWTNPDEVATHLARRLDAAEGDERIELIAQLAINDPDRAVRHLPEVINAMEEQLEGDPTTRFMALLIFEHLGPDSLSSVPILCKAAEALMRDGDLYELDRIVRLIASLGAADSPEARDLLRAMIAHHIRDPLSPHSFKVIVSSGLDLTAALVEVSRIPRDDPAERQAITQLMDVLGIGPPLLGEALHDANSQD